MTRLLLAFAVCISVFATTALAQDKEPQGERLTVFTRAPCDPLPKMINTIAKYKEEILFVGDGMTFAAQSGQPLVGNMMFLVNQETGTWSMLQIFKDGLACMVINGKKFEPYTGPSSYVKDTPTDSN